MSSSDVMDTPAAHLQCVMALLNAALNDPSRIADEELRNLIALTMRIYAAKADGGMRSPLPPGGGGLTITDAMLTVTDVLHALNVQLFELSMWQAMSGNSIAPHHRIDAP